MGVIHCPDVEKNPIWPIKTYKTSTFINDSNLKIITWNNKDKGCFEKSCEDSNVLVEVFGKEIEKWNNYLKFKYNIEAASDTSCEYIMGCDSHDVLLLGSPSLILEKFKEKKCKLLFNCEKHFYPDLNEEVIQNWKSYQYKLSGNNVFKYLNSGVWIGERLFVKKFFEYCSGVFVYNLLDCSNYEFLKKDSIGCDQSTVHDAFMKFYPDVKLNYEADIFLNISNFKKEDISFIHKFL